MLTSWRLVTGIFIFVVSQLLIPPVSAQGDSRNSSCYDYGVRKDCFVRQTYSRLAGNSGFHIIANWSDGDTTEMFIPSKASRDNTVYAKWNGSEWIPARFNFCNIDTPNVRYVRAEWGEGNEKGGTGCIPDFIPAY